MDAQRARRKLVDMLPRQTLDEVSGVLRPSTKGREYLIGVCVNRWDQRVSDAVRAELARVQEAAELHPLT